MSQRLISKNTFYGKEKFLILSSHIHSNQCNLLTLTENQYFYDTIVKVRLIIIIKNMNKFLIILYMLSWFTLKFRFFANDIRFSKFCIQLKLKYFKLRYSNLILELV